MTSGYNFFGELAAADGFNQVDGRRDLNDDEINQVLEDVLTKIGNPKGHSIYNIGCGYGKLTQSLIEAWLNCGNKIVLQDHPNIIERLKKKYITNEKLKFVVGEFPNQADTCNGFDLVFVYSVFHYIDPKYRLEFIKSCLDKLRPEGVLFIGDIPNIDLRNRESKRQSFIDIQSRHMNSYNEVYYSEEYKNILRLPGDALFDDLRQLCLNQKNCEVYLLPQNPKLPYGYVRQDIKFIKREFYD